MCLPGQTFSLHKIRRLLPPDLMNTPQPLRHILLAPNAWQTSCLTIGILALIVAVADARPTLPPIPKGVSVLNTEPGDKGLRDGILSNTDIDMISISEPWNMIQPGEVTDPVPDWSYIDNTIAKIASYNNNKSVLLRILTMGGSAYNEGNTPDWVFTDMGEDPKITTYDPGKTYSWTDSDQVTTCIPVFWNPVYLAKKKALIAMAGAHITNDPLLNSTIKIVGVSYANAITEDWNIPDDDSGDPSQLELWQNTPSDVPAGAGYTTDLMINAAIHQGDAIFTDGMVQGTTLTSLSATFTQADVRHRVGGRGYGSNTFIVAWISPTQVTLNQTVSTGTGAKFKIIARRDGLIDVAIAAFPNQYICASVGGNGPNLDNPCATDEDPGTCLASQVDSMAQTTYPGHYIVQRNNVTAIIPFSYDIDVDNTAWVLLNEAVMAETPTAGQALGPAFTNGGDSRMNGGNDCDHDRTECTYPCPDDCIISNCTILERSADRIMSYSANYYEVYPPDASNLQDAITYIHCLLNPMSGSRWFTKSLDLMTKGIPANRVRNLPPTDCVECQ